MPISTQREPVVEVDDSAADPTFSVGEVSSRTGLPAPTLRTWERRYGVGPTERTPGGHRRYSEADIARVELLGRLIARGVGAREAAELAIAGDPRAGGRPAEGGPLGGGLDLASLVASPQALITTVVDAASRHDAALIAELVGQVLRSHDVVTAWDTYLSPMLVRIGQEWERGVLDIGAEHLVSERVSVELRAHVQRGSELDQSQGLVVVASAEDDQHSLPVVALQAALADRSVACHCLGARLPAAALAKVVATVEPAAVFVWASLKRSSTDHMWRVVTSAPPETLVLIGGPGWPIEQSGESGPSAPVRTSDLASAVRLVLAHLAEPAPA